MPFLPALGLQTEQPKSLLRLDENHPLYPDIVFAYSAGRGDSDGRHGPGSATGTITRSAGARGKRVAPADATSYVGLTHSDDHNTLGGVTIIAVIRTSASFAAQQGLVTKCETGGGTNTPWAMLIESGGKPSLNRSNTGVSAFRVWSAAATLAANTEYVVAISQGTDISVAPRFYINGAFDTGAPSSLYSGAGTGAATGNTTSVKIGNRTDLASQSFSAVYDAVVFKRVLTDAQIVGLSRNIHQVWEPEPLYWFFTIGGTTYNQSIDGSITAAGALTKQSVKQLAGSYTCSGGLVKQTAKSYTGSLTAAGAVAKRTAKSFAGSITGSGALSTMILFTADLAGSLTPSGAISKMTIKALAGASTLAGAITKKTFRTLDGNITVAGTITKLTTKAFSGAVTVAGALTESYQVLKSLAGSITPSGALGAAYIAFVAGVLKLLALMGIGQ